MHCQAVLDATRRSAERLSIEFKIALLSDTINDAITLIEKKADIYEKLWQDAVVERLGVETELVKEKKNHQRTKKFLANALVMLDKLSKEK